MTQKFEETNDRTSSNVCAYTTPADILHLQTLLMSNKYDNVKRSYRCINLSERYDNSHKQSE